MKKILSLLLLLSFLPLWAEHEVVSVTPHSGYTSYVINYTSVDADCVTPTTVSGVITVPTNPQGTPVWIIDNHHTFTDDASAPSNVGTSAAGQLGFSKNFVVIATDYLGYGYTSDQRHPYLCQRQNAINSIDLLKVAIEMLPEMGIEPLALFNIGYSQGGGVAMAVHQEIESAMMTDPVLGQYMSGLLGFASWCGAGPYNPVATVQAAFDSPELLTFPAVVPLLINGFLAGAPAELRKEYQFSDFFQPALIQPTMLTNPYTGESIAYPGLEALMTAKLLDEHQISMLMVLAAGFKQGLADFISPDMLDPESQLHQDFFAWLALNNLLEGQAPMYPLSLYHLAEDDIVTAANLQLAIEAFPIPDNRVHLYSSAYPGMENFSTHSDFAALFFSKVADEILDLIMTTDLHKLPTEDAPTYNLHGILVGPDYRGIVISGGRRFIRN